MDELQEDTGTRGASMVQKVATVVASAFAAIALIVALVERNQAQRASSKYDEVTTSLDQARGDISTLSSKLNQVEAQAEQQAQAAAQAEGAKGRRHGRKAADDPRWKKVQSELDEHQQAIDSTKSAVDQNRADLETQLGSARDELNGSIAKNHSELVALAKRGERDYAEFDLKRSKGFQHVGPVSMSLRKASPKDKFCDLVLIVDDVQIPRRHANLYEPVQMYASDYDHTIEVVINYIGRNEARGYVSVPKFKKSELASAGEPAPAQTAPAPAPTAAPAPETAPPPDANGDIPHRSEPQPNPQK